jgi:hypothetical protein
MLINYTIDDKTLNFNTILEDSNRLKVYDIELCKHAVIYSGKYKEKEKFINSFYSLKKLILYGYSNKEDCTYHCIFEVEGCVYKYGVEVKNYRIVNEYFNYYENGVWIQVFTRKDNELEFYTTIKFTLLKYYELEDDVTFITKLIYFKDEFLRIKKYFEHIIVVGLGYLAENLSIKYYHIKNDASFLDSFIHFFNSPIPESGTEFKKFYIKLCKEEQILLGLLVDIVYAGINKELLIINNFDNLLHENHLQKLINIMDKLDGQFIMFLQNTSFMNSFTGDEIWFLDDELRSLAEYRNWKTGNIAANYKRGRFGGIPSL